MRTGAEIPGVRIGQGDPYLVTRPSAEAKRRAQALVDGPGLTAITAAPEGDMSEQGTDPTTSTP